VIFSPEYSFPTTGSNLKTKEKVQSSKTCRLGDDQRESIRRTFSRAAIFLNLFGFHVGITPTNFSQLNFKHEDDVLKPSGALNRSSVESQFRKFA
jgi:hypothetical protein